MNQTGKTVAFFFQGFQRSYKLLTRVIMVKVKNFSLCPITGKKSSTESDKIALGKFKFTFYSIIHIDHLSKTCYNKTESVSVQTAAVKRLIRKTLHHTGSRTGQEGHTSHPGIRKQPDPEDGRG